MKLFLTDDEKLYLRPLFKQIAESPNVKMTKNEAMIFGELYNRINSLHPEHNYEKRHITCLASIIHQVLENIEKMDEKDQEWYGITNNILLMVLDRLNQKLGISKRTLKDIEGK